MKKFRFKSPYTSEGKTTFPESKKRTGCYLIKENGVLVYVGFSGINLYKTLYRHFQKWHHKYQEVITYQAKLKARNYTVRIVYCTAKQAATLEKGLIIKYQPRDNIEKYKSYQMTSDDTKVLNNYFQIETEPAPF